VLATIKQIHSTTGIGVLLVEQNVSRTLKVVDRAVILKMGRVVSDGPATELNDRQDLWEWF
jgi:branched-chain amino acid transport system ATP-binding protein